MFSFLAEQYFLLSKYPVFFKEFLQLTNSVISRWPRYIPYNDSSHRAGSLIQTQTGGGGGGNGGGKSSLPRNSRLRPFQEHRLTRVVKADEVLLDPPLITRLLLFLSRP